jgi:hypothetical protein
MKSIFKRKGGICFLWIRSFMCMLIFLLFAGCSVGLKISRGVCKLTRTTRVIYIKKKTKKEKDVDLTLQITIYLHSMKKRFILKTSLPQKLEEKQSRR